MTVFKLQDIVVRCDRERIFGFIRALVRVGHYHNNSNFPLHMG